MFPLEFTRTLEGLMSLCMMRWASYRYTNPPSIDSVIFPSTSTRTGPKSFEMRSSDLSVVSVGALRECVQATRHLPTIHILHAKHNVPCIILKCTIKRNDIGRAAIMANLQLSKDLFANVLLCINPYYLSRGLVSI